LIYVICPIRLSPKFLGVGIFITGVFQSNPDNGKP